VTRFGLLYDPVNDDWIYVNLGEGAFFQRTVYRQIALGHFNFSLTYKMLPWDHAAGVLVHTEAGGICRTLNGQEYNPTMLYGEMLAAQSEQQWQALAEYFRN